MSMLKPLTKINVADLWKEVKDEDTLWGDLKQETRFLLKNLLAGCMKQELKTYLNAGRHERKEERVSYRNGCYERSLDTELGVIEGLSIPRSRDGGFKTKVFESYQRRQEAVNDSIKEMFIHGVSARQVGDVLEPLLGKKICSAQTVSNIVKELDSEVETFHKRPLEDKYTYLFLDGIYLSKKKAIGTTKKPVLVAYGITMEGKRELIDYRQANSESEGAWFSLLDDLYHRGLRGNNLKLIITDGCKGLLAALDMAYPYPDRQRCWAHKMRNVLNKVRKKDQKEVKDRAIKIYLAENRKEVIENYWEWAKRWREIYPKAVECIEKDLDELLSFLKFPEEHRVKIRTTNAIERVFREVRKRTRPMSTFNNKESCDRIIFALFHFMNEKWGKKPLKEFTQNS